MILEHNVTEWPPRHCLFLVLRPPPSVLPFISEVRDACAGPPSIVSDARLHVTLLGLGAFDGAVPTALIAAVRRAMAMFRSPPIWIMMDQLIASAHSAAIRPSDPLRHLETFQRSLAALMAQACARPVPNDRFSPHITLRYRPYWLRSAEIEPISWHAEEVWLIDSFVGQTRHVALGRWRLS